MRPPNITIRENPDGTFQGVDQSNKPVGPEHRDRRSADEWLDQWEGGEKNPGDVNAPPPAERTAPEPMPERSPDRGDNTPTDRPPRARK